MKTPALPSEDDLDVFWDDLKSKAVRTPQEAPKSDLELLDIASEQVRVTLTEFVRKKYDRQSVTAEMLADIVTKGMESFISRWRTVVTNQSLGGLIQATLASSDLSHGEIQEFIRALPLKILERLVVVEGPPTGVNYLLSLEYLRREGSVAYVLGRENSRVWAEFSHPKTKEVVRFYLDEAVRLPSD